MRFDQLAAMAGGHLRTTELGSHTFTGVSTDSRTVRSGMLFFAIRGEKHDGHRFVEQVIAQGAAGIVVDRTSALSAAVPGSVAVVEVENTHAAMLRLASEYLTTLPARRLGITGSNGKTTTKEFAYRLLSAFDPGVYRSPGNFNNLFGIPLALFAMPADTRWAVLEMGISVPGEMDRLASIVRPHLLAVTNVGPTHLEFLGTVENVAREKLTALRHAAPDAPLIVNGDDPILSAEARRVHPRPTTYAVEAAADFRPDAIRSEVDGTVVSIEGHRFRLPVFGQYQVYNLLAAYAIARAVGCDFDGVATEAIPLATASMRGETVQAGGLTFIADCYNANPESVKAGLTSFARQAAYGRRVVILGDMLELGDSSAAYHREIGTALGAGSFDLILTVGPMSRHTVEAAQASGVAAGMIYHFDDARSCADAAAGLLRAGDLIYLKGSRGIGLEAVLKRFSETGKES